MVWKAQIPSQRNTTSMHRNMDSFRAPHLTTMEDGDGERPQDHSYLDRHLVEARTVLVSGPITDKMAREFTVRLMVIERMDPERPVTVMINSPGGSADSGFAMYDLMRFVRPPLLTVVNGLCASAAILVLLGAEGKRRFSMPESRFMIHQPATTGHGTASDLDITAREIIKLRERYNRIISNATGQEMEKVLGDSKRDFWLNATEALEYGLVTEVVTERSQMED